MKTMGLNISQLNKNNTALVKTLGQSGVVLRLSNSVIYIDPYLSNSVQELDAPDLERQIKIPFKPESVVDADWVLITHEHMDHCDPHTLPILAKASPHAKFIGPAPTIELLKSWGIAHERLTVATESWRLLDDDLEIIATPAAHMNIERDDKGQLRFVGYILKYREKKIYFAGDTVVCDELVESLMKHLPIHTAFLPVNEHNYYKNKRGIVGNMSPREAFQLAAQLGVKQVVALHWDMFAINSVSPEEIRLVHEKMQNSFELLIEPSQLQFNEITVSIIIRTLNEGQYLDQLLSGIFSQKLDNHGIEVIIVDSGSTDDTLKIAEKYNCRILHILREEFSFGRSLNIGCEAAKGRVLVFTSGHCVPASSSWLINLVSPIINGDVQYTYGRQLGGPSTRYSETQIFLKYFPATTANFQEDFFCNNANAALLKDAWARYTFDESLTGLEDIALGKRLIGDGGSLAYISGAPVFHHHHESWNQVRRRFEREAIALQEIMPQLHITLFDTLKYIAFGIVSDSYQAMRAGVFLANFLDIMRYRYSQYMGTYFGNHQHRKLSLMEKDRYFFPF